MKLEKFIKELEKHNKETQILSFDEKEGDYHDPEIFKANGKYFIVGKKNEK